MDAITASFLVTSAAALVMCVAALARRHDEWLRVLAALWVLSLALALTGALVLLARSGRTIQAKEREQGAKAASYYAMEPASPALTGSGSYARRTRANRFLDFCAGAAVPARQTPSKDTMVMRTHDHPGVDAVIVHPGKTARDRRFLAGPE
jgi:hypothetical protein